MSTRRMRIDDYELMAHARRAYLAYLDARELAGDPLNADEERFREALRADTRLEGALTMDWEVVPEVDAALIAALEHLLAHVREELAAQRIPPEHLDGYAARRKEAIADTIARLRGEPGPGGR